MENIQEIVTYLSENKPALIGAIGTIIEIIILVFNLFRKLKAKKHAQMRVQSVARKPKKVRKQVAIHAAKYNSKIRTLLWSANPINLFRSA